MLRRIQNVLFLGVIALGALLGSKLLWDNYQSKRAVEQLPAVLAIIEQIRPFSNSVRTDSGQGSISVNEYAAAVWRNYMADAPCVEISTHLDAEAIRNGFQWEGGSFRKEQYEIRTSFEHHTSAQCEYAVGANWYGLDR